MINSALTAHLGINCVSTYHGEFIISCSFVAMYRKRSKQALFILISWLSILNTGVAQDSLNQRLLNNVFDVYRTDGDSLNIVPSDYGQEEDLANLSVAEAASELDEENPFEVNHIPIRKNQLVDKSITDSDETPLDFFRKHLGLWAIILMVALIAIALGINRDIIGKKFRALINDNHLLIFHRDEREGLSPASLLLVCNCIFNFSLLVLSAQTEASQQTFLNFILLFLVMAGLYVLKYCLLSFIKWVYPSLKKIINFYLTLSISILGMIGIVLTIFNFFIHYGPDFIRTVFLVTALIIISLSYVFRYGRTILSHTYLFSNNVFFFLLYLCATEIAPVIIIYKVVVDHLNF